MSEAARHAGALAAAAAVLATAAGSGSTVTAKAASRSSSDISSNWAGYAVTGLDPVSPTSFTSASGTWKQPKAGCRAGAGRSASAIWVGLGGYDSSTAALQQIGTDADCSPTGKPVYYAWYELLPKPSVRLALTIKPGDTITASVNLVAARTGLRLQITDRSTGASVTKQLAAAEASPSSAEWIVEAPSTCDRFTCRPVPLANFGSVSFTKIGAVGGGHSGTILDSAWTAVPIQLMPRGGHEFFPGGPHSETGQSGSTAAAVPSDLSVDGRSFKVSWLANASLLAGLAR